MSYGFKEGILTDSFDALKAKGIRTPSPACAGATSCRIVRLLRSKIGGRIRGKGGKIVMKKHRFFAWMTVICFLLTMITGYKKK
jgi:hypothetical protein